MLDTLSDGLAATSVLQTTQPELTVSDGMASGTTGCNSFGGEFELNGSALAVSGLFWTEIGCEPGVMDQEAFILEVLMQADRLEIEGERLTIFAGERFLSYRAG